MIEQRIRELLAARQLSPTQFADTIGVSRPIVSHILSGRNKPSLEVVQKIIGAFPELSLSWLLSGSGQMLDLPPLQASETATVRPLRGHREGNSTPKAAKALEAPKAAPSPASSEPVQATQALSTVPEPPAHATATEALPVSAPLLASPPEAQAAAFATAGKRIRRIVIFYQDGTFSDFQPE
ncbi:helix-turn-helix transcriptional regulator [Hymenobacter sp. HSC-4F20]|uniref:helix-turn-helix transcriptional regulator n=1 Tax=Hymenobacter sp. HSC-4F20 TaxID=2864135 RepID=UPI001C7377FF|nr:helix-turn-helix transcriptional regulator [Hymenobacter sp. HSC-4F20]